MIEAIRNWIERELEARQRRSDVRFVAKMRRKLERARKGSGGNSVGL